MCKFMQGFGYWNRHIQVWVTHSINEFKLKPDNMLARKDISFCFDFDLKFCHSAGIFWHSDETIDQTVCLGQ